MNRYLAIILAPVTALASCMAIKANPPAPTITTLSVGFRLVFFTAPYAVGIKLLYKFKSIHKYVK
jgi:hypothetical protein